MVKVLILEVLSNGGEHYLYTHMLRLVGLARGPPHDLRSCGVATFDRYLELHNFTKEIRRGERRGNSFTFRSF